MKTTSNLIIVTVIVLVISANLTLATEINLMYGGKLAEKANFDRSKFFDKNFIVNGDKLHLTISGKNNYTLNSILLFLCRDKMPTDCSLENPIEYERFVDTNFNLTDISVNTKANILSLIKVENSWLGSWDSIENGIWKTQEIDKINLYLKYNTPTELKNVIEEFGPIPFNFIENADFGGKQLQILEGKSASGLFRKEKINITNKRLETQLGNKKGYSFVLPTDNFIYNPLTFFEIADSCGNLKCEPEVGEAHQTCWQDCECPEGQAPTPQGCVPKSDIALIIDSVDPDTEECYLTQGVKAFESVDGCAFFHPIKVKLHINNTPINYSKSQPYFFVGDKSYLLGDENSQGEWGRCYPDDVGFNIIESKLLGVPPQLVYNASKFTCNLVLPPLNKDKEFEEKKAFAVIFPITYSRGNKTETQPLTAKTGLNIKGTNLKPDLSELEDMQKKLRDMMGDMNQLNKFLHFLKMAQISAYIIKTATEGCCGVPYTAATCCPQIGWWTLVNIAIYIGIEELGDYIKDDAEKKMDKLRAEANKEIEESIQENKIKISQGVPNLVWVHGKKSGLYTDSVCGDEGVEIWYAFDVFGCTERDGLWFNFNNQTRPQCDCQAYKWTDQNSIWGDFCDCSPTTLFSMDTADHGGKQFGMRKYRPSGNNLLLNTTADKLFDYASGRNKLNITVLCAADHIGDLKTEFELLNYTATCR